MQKIFQFFRKKILSIMYKTIISRIDIFIVLKYELILFRNTRKITTLIFMN